MNCILRKTIPFTCTIAVAVFAPGAEAGPHPQRKSTISFGRSERLESSVPAKKRRFRQDLEAVSKAHDSWKKAHLNSVLYSCQRNAERVSALARQVADKIEAAKKEATLDAKALERPLEEMLAGGVEIPDSVPEAKLEKLKARLKQLELARKHSAVLEKLAWQVNNFYLKDAPRTSSFPGGCAAAYPQALRKGIAASTHYYSEAGVLHRKLEKLEKLTSTAYNIWWKKKKREMLADAGGL